ncbi:stage III sporulation protein D [Jeotgalibacillus malaysiensis]|uniref:Stage III sporulation protein D n=1 Tax=Jeotgalibacillus malaysiensis TaxID=1508404 RepID=A0A0B5AQ39_9BACL|nr:sporulation transcriptional regulator SpoIIID [Jeotgalibacillus malaysiensis]AJD92315.1 stage III sporulation protein D [Jeotgalibacillus malaysiensis]
MHEYIRERTISAGRHIVETEETVRSSVKIFGVSKSTVHKSLTERLPKLDPALADEVTTILHYHKAIRHLRGGEATKAKYEKQQPLSN